MAHARAGTIEFSEAETCIFLRMQYHYLQCRSICQRIRSSYGFAWNESAFNRTSHGGWADGLFSHERFSGNRDFPIRDAARVDDIIRRFQEARRGVIASAVLVLGLRRAAPERERARQFAGRAGIRARPGARWRSWRHDLPFASERRFDCDIMGIWIVLWRRGGRDFRVAFRVLAAPGRDGDTRNGVRGQTSGRFSRGAWTNVSARSIISRGRCAGSPLTKNARFKSRASNIAAPRSMRGRTASRGTTRRHPKLWRAVGANWRRSRSKSRGCGAAKTIARAHSNGPHQ